MNFTKPFPRHKGNFYIIPERSFMDKFYSVLLNFSLMLQFSIPLFYPPFDIKEETEKITSASFLAIIFEKKNFLIDADPDIHLQATFGSEGEITLLVEVKEIIKESTRAESGKTLHYFQT